MERPPKYHIALLQISKILHMQLPLPNSFYFFVSTLYSDYSLKFCSSFKTPSDILLSQTHLRALLVALCLVFVFLIFVMLLVLLTCLSEPLDLELLESREQCVLGLNMLYIPCGGQVCGFTGDGMYIK